MNDKTGDVFVRVIVTFAETAGAYLIAHLSGVNFFNGNPGKTFWIGLALSTGAAGLSAAWNGVLQPLLQSKMKAKAAE